jgi:hypothetical protein
VASEELPSPFGMNVPFADKLDEIQARECGDIGRATHELVVVQVNRRSTAPARLNEARLD